MRWRHIVYITWNTKNVQIEEDGYYVVKRLLTAEEVDACKKEIKEIVYKWYENFERTGVEGNDWEEPVNRMPAIKEGEAPDARG